MIVFSKKKLALGSFFAVFTVLVLLGAKTSMQLHAATIADNSSIKRGEAVVFLVKNLDLKDKKKTFLSSCHTNIAECIFAFAARSNYDFIKTEPLILYPDVFPAYRYYEEINIASLLDIVTGYWGEENSPFRPEESLSQIEALKIVFIGTEIFPWKEKFELENEKNNISVTNSESRNFSEEINSKIDPLNSAQWWYFRYINFAVQNNLINLDNFEPNQSITEEEFRDLLIKAADYQQSYGEKTIKKTDTSGNS